MERNEQGRRKVRTKSSEENRKETKGWQGYFPSRATIPHRHVPMIQGSKKEKRKGVVRGKGGEKNRRSHDTAREIC